MCDALYKTATITLGITGYARNAEVRTAVCFLLPLQHGRTPYRYSMGAPLGMRIDMNTIAGKEKASGGRANIPVRTAIPLPLRL